MNDIAERLDVLGTKLITCSSPWSVWAHCIFEAKAEIERLNGLADKAIDDLCIWAEEATDEVARERLYEIARQLEGSDNCETSQEVK